jgi:hypothetical protein
LKIFATILAFNAVLLSSLAASGEIKELRSDHFIISSQRDVDEAYVDTVKDLAETYYKTITQEFNLIRDKLWLWDNRAKIFIAKDKEDYLRKYGCPSWSDACVNYTTKMIYTYPNQAHFSSILAHELTHIIFREYVGGGRLPLWLEEGIAVYIDDKYGKRNASFSLNLVRKAIENKTYIPFVNLNYITTALLNKQPKNYVNLFYAESFSIVAFLIEKGSRDNFFNLLYFLRNGNNINDALKKSFISIKNMDDFEKQWIKFYQG